MVDGAAKHKDQTSTQNSTSETAGRPGAGGHRPHRYTVGTHTLSPGTYPPEYRAGLSSVTAPWGYARSSPELRLHRGRRRPHLLRLLRPRPHRPAHPRPHPAPPAPWPPRWPSVTAADAD